MNPPKPDPFAALLGARRGVAGASPWPRYAPPASSSAPPVLSLADFRRRLRPGVVGVLDALNGFGQVVERSRCVVQRGPRHREPWWLVQGFDEDQQCWWSSGENFPRRASDCRLEGPSLQHRGWRFTFLDERAPNLKRRNLSASLHCPPKPGAQSRPSCNGARPSVGART